MKVGDLARFRDCDVRDLVLVLEVKVQKTRSPHQCGEDAPYEVTQYVVLNQRTGLKRCYNSYYLEKVS